MGWGLEVPMYLSRVTKEELPYKKEEVEDLIKYLRNQIIAAVAYTNPIIQDGEETQSLMHYASFEIPRILNDLSEAEVELAMINVALSDVDSVIVDT